MNLVGSGTVNGKIYGSATLGTLAPTTSGGIEIDLLNGGDSSSAFTGAETATVQLVIRKDTNANWNANNPILNDGELGFITDDQQFFVGDGVTAYQDLLDAHYIVHWDELTSILSGLNNSISDLQSAVTGNTNDINTLDNGLQQELLDRANGDSTLQGNIDILDSSVTGLTSSVSSLQSGVNGLVSDVGTIQSDITTLQSVDSGLQGQIDTINTSLADGMMKKYTLQFNASDVPSVDGIPFNIITPSTGKYLQLISACIISNGTSPSGRGFNATFIPSELIATFDFPDTGDYGLYPLQINMNFLSFIQMNQPLQLMLTNDSFESGDTQITLTIFYMEV